ncbi:MAG TPA: TetR/AcrR family transcriptional regulator [Bacteroidales bacterium]|nr:TetR/AcrR family transcriptional regulator [Bacteroidales bacterium]
MNVNLLSKKQSALLSNARMLFWQLGYRKVTIEDVCKHAGVSKMTFYKFYPDKLALAKAVYSMEAEMSLNRFRAIMQSEEAVDKKLEAIITLKSDAVENISQAFLHDFYVDEQLGLKEFVGQLTNDSWQDILVLFGEAQQKGEFRKDFNPAFFLFIAQKIGEFITDPYLTRLSGGSREAIMEITRLFTWGIAPRDLNSKP